jgi:hypothetical protein
MAKRRKTRWKLRRSGEFFAGLHWFVVQLVMLALALIAAFKLIRGEFLTLF